jgi:UPF0042 nucleotide-binding protein
LCVDNLPPELLRSFMRLEQTKAERRVAVAVDSRNAGSLPLLLPLLEQLRREGVNIRSIFLDATDEALVRRFSETRRPHPLSEGEGNSRRALVDSIQLERQLLRELREFSTVMDTSLLRPPQMRAWMRALVNEAASKMTLVFESFGFKNGVPLDADYVFDIRMLPNPHYAPDLRPLTGKDAAVAAFLEAQPEVPRMLADIDVFLRRWLPSFEADQRSYLTVAIGCTGGQHRSVYFAEQLSRLFADRTGTIVRHRELDALLPKGAAS